MGDTYLVWQARITGFGLVRKNWAGNGSKFGFSSGTGYKSGPCFETRTGTKLGPEPELVLFANNAFGEKK